MGKTGGLLVLDACSKVHALCPVCALLIGCQLAQRRVWLPYI